MSIETIREVLAVANTWIPDDAYDDIDKLNAGIDVLSTIEPDAIRAEKDAEIAKLRAEKDE